jgi:Trk-type K+ transport system membrane component
MRFDNTITLGNVLTAIAMVIGGGAAWMNMSERVTRTEQAQTVLREADARHESELRTIKSDGREVLLEIKADIKELRNDLKRK